MIAKVRLGEMAADFQNKLARLQGNDLRPPF